MPVRSDRDRASICCELGADGSSVLRAFVHLEREYSGPGLCRDDGDAVRADELPEDVRAHGVGQPQLHGRVLAVARSVQCTDRGGGIDRVAQVGRGRWSASGAQALVTELAEAVREIGVAGCSSWQCGPLEEACAIQAEQSFLST